MLNEVLQENAVNYYEQIKNELVDVAVHKKVREYIDNHYELERYYNVGKLIIEAQGGEEKAKYGDSLIKDYSRRLTKELGKGYSSTNLKYMRQFYILFQKGQALPDQLTWSHIVILLQLNDINFINYYIDITIKQNLGYRRLREKIKACEYERLDIETKTKLINKDDIVVGDLIKNPIVINTNNNYEYISEKVLKELILADMEHFLEELGDGFSFIKSEYKLKMGSTYNYIDILLFNYIYNAFVVVELKVTELKKEHFGQIKSYMNYIDKEVKKVTQDNTIGLIICKKNNKYILEYSSDERIKTREFSINVKTNY